MSQSLLSIADDVLALDQLLETLEGGELTAEAEAALDAWFAEVGAAKEQKIDNYCALVRVLELRSAARKEEAERLTALVRAESNKARRLKERLQLFLDITGERRVDTARYRVTVCANGGKQPLQIQAPATALPEEFLRVTVEVDAEKVRAALEAGQEVFGCKFVPRGQHLRIA